MILCVTGIILVQWYFINTTIQNRDQEFSLAVKQSLNSVASDVQENELRHYIQTFEKLKDSIGKPDSVQLRNFFFFTIVMMSQIYLLYSHLGLLKKNLI